MEKVVVDCSGKPGRQKETRVPLTDEEVQEAKEMAANAPDADAIIKRRYRNGLLAASDWTQVPDAPLTEAKRKQWAKYRQALRDNPTGPWPDQPK